MSNRSPSDNSPSIRESHVELRQGRDVLSAFQLAPDLIHLNHGSFGAVPRSVQVEQDRWRALIERDATGFFKDVLPDELRRLAGCVASRFGGKAGDWVFVENATQAVNGVLASFALEDGDEIVTTSHAYGAVLKTLQLWTGRRNAKLVVAEIPFVLQSDEQVIEAVRNSITRRTRLLVVDHITSSTATIFPAKAIVRIAREAGVAVLVDGAHVPGHLPLDVEDIAADWYTGNAHKWFFAPKGCGLLWTSPVRQAATWPAVLSWGSDQGYRDAFDWIGTRDVTPWLCFESAAAAHDGFGGADLMARNRRLACEAASYLIENTGRIISSPPAMRGAMAAIALGPAPADPDWPTALRRRLSRDHGIVLPVSAFGNHLWVRISCQVYNEWSNYEALRAALHGIAPR